MADIDFPSNPSLDDTYTDPNGWVWIYNGESWNKTFTDNIKPTLSLNDVEDVNIGRPKPQDIRYLTYESGGWNDVSTLGNAPNSYEWVMYDSVARDKDYYFTGGGTSHAEIVIPYNTVWRDSMNTNSWNTSTFTFTVPLTGFYTFNMFHTGLDMRDGYKLMMYRNGSFYKPLFQRWAGVGFNFDNNASFNASDMSYLNQSDTIQFKVITFCSYTYAGTFAGSAYNQLNIRLII